MNRADKALIGITIVASLMVLVPLTISFSNSQDFNITESVLQAAYGQTDAEFGATSGLTSDITIGGFESLSDDIVMTPPPDDIVMTPPPNNIFTSGDTPFNDYTFPPPQEIEITTPVTGLEELPHGVETSTYEKFQDGYTWEINEGGFLFKAWDENKIGSIPEPKPEYPQVTENYTIIKNDDGSLTFETHSPYIVDNHEWKPYILGDDDLITQVQTNGGTVVFDKVAGAVTIFNKYEKVVESDSYIIRTALIDSDVWSNLDVNDSPVETVIEEDGEKITVSFIRENDEGKYTTEYAIHSGKVKTTVYFTNYIYDNNKFAFTQTLDLPDNIISVNGMEDIDLNDYVGMSFDRATLEANIDLVLEIKSIHYSSGLGFDNLWSVNVSSPTKVSLDYANVEQTQTEIGDTVELDPTYTLSKESTASPASSTSSYGNSQGDSLGCGGRIASGTQGYNITWNLRNYVGSWNTWNGCRTAMVGFDLSGIPDTAIVSDTKLKYNIFYHNNAGTFDLNQMTQSGQDGWGMWNNDVNQPVGTNPYSVYNTTNWDKTWEMYLDANNLGTQPNGAGSQYAYNLSSAVGTNIQTDLGAAGNADVMAQLNASTSVNGVADWFAIGMPYSAMKNGATAATNWTSQSVQTANTQDMDFDNVQLQVTYYSPPEEPANLTVTANGSNVDLTWSESDNYSNYEVSTHANSYTLQTHTTATCSGGASSATAPTLGQTGVIGTSMYFDGVCDTLEGLAPGASSSQGSAVTFAVWLKSDAGSTDMADIPFGKVGAGFNYLMVNNQWSSYGYGANSIATNGLYTGPNSFAPNEWFHYAFTVAADKTTHLYINGVDVPLYSSYVTANQSTPTTVGNSNGEVFYDWNLGSGYHTSTSIMNYPFIGWMDDMIVWHDVLTPAEITAVYSGSGTHPFDIVGANTLEYYLPMDDSSLPLTNYVVTTQPSADTVTYNIQRDGTNILSTTNLLVSDTTASFNVPYQYSISAYNNAGGASTVNNSDYVVSSDAVSTDGTNNGATTGVGGIIGNSWDFDGVNDYVDLPQMSLNNSDGHSWSVWANLGGGSGGTASGAMELIGVANYVNLLIADEATLGVSNYSIYYNGVTSGTGYNTQNSGWHHYAGVTDCNGYTQWQCPVTIYMDGTSIGTGTYGMHSSADYTIGARNGSGSQSLFTNGLIDEFAVFERALTSSEIATLYNSGSANTPYALSLGNDLTHYYNFEQTGNTLTNMAVTDDPSSYAITLIVPPPTALSATLNIPNVDLSWTGGAGATGYKIEHSTDGANWSTLVANTGNTNTTYTHTAPTQNIDNYYQVRTLIGSDESTGNTATTALTATNYRTYIDNASSTSCVATGTIYEDGSRGNGVPSQGSGNRYCESTSMEYDISGIPDSATIIETDIDETHNIWTAGWNPSCEYKANTTVQPSTGTGAQKYSATQTGTVYAYDPLCTTTAGTTYNVPLSAQANTDLQNQLSSDWFAISWTMDGFPVLSQTGSGTPSSVNSGSATLNVLHTAPASTTVGGAPDAPTGITATFNNSTLDMDLAWTAPSVTNGSPVTGYKVEVSTDGLTWTTVINTTNTNTTYSHVSPTIGVLNYYKVSATNAYGTGATDHGLYTMNTEYSSGNTILTFLDNTIFTPTTSFNVEYLVIGSGGSGGIGGGGAGEFKTGTGHSLTAQDYSITIGVGGVGNGGYNSGADGNSTIFDSITSIGGGGAGGNDVAENPGNNGGSGGGGGSKNGGTTIMYGGTSTSGGNNGGSGVTATYPNISGGGGGGAGSAGADGVAAVGGDGGDGLLSNITGLTYAGGGGATGWLGSNGSGGSGGGGDFQTDGADNTGSGGGSTTSASASSGAGGSGVVVIKFPTSGNTFFPTGIVNALAGGPPDAPTNLTVSYNEPNADLTWVAPTVTNGSAVIGYKVETSLDNVNWTPVTVLTNTNVTYSHTNPTVGSDNYYRVSAINSIGTGVPGNVASVLAATIPTAPLSLTTTQTVPFFLDLSWSVPSDDGDTPITNYKVYRDGSLVTTLGVVTTYQDNTMQHIGHTHSYEVSAVNVIGESPKSNASSVTGWDVPSATTSVTATPRAGQQNEIDWTAPTSDGGTSITGYRIQSSTDNVTFTDVVASTTTQPYTHTGLTQGTTYYYKVSAINAIGEGTFGAASATVGDVPDAPASLTVVPQAGMQMTITVTIPNDNGYAISSYSLQRSTDNFTTFTVVGPQASNVFVDYPLNIGTSYQYKALATNSLGDSALSSASATTVAGDVPSTPVAPGTVVALS